MLLVFFLLRHLAILLLLGAAAWTVGTLALALLRRHAVAVPWGVTVAAGLAIVGHLCYLAALAGWLTRATALALAAALIAIGVARISRLPRPFGFTLFGDASGRFIWIVRAALAWIVVSSFLLALYPPLGFDETMYHLPFARAIAETGGLSFMPALRFPAFPQLAESISAAFLLVTRDDVATQVTGWLATAACIGLTATWTRQLCYGTPPGRMRIRAVAVKDEEAREVEGEPVPYRDAIGSMAMARAAGWIAAAALLGSPMAIHLTGAGYVEPLLALCGLGALYAAWRAARARAELVDDAATVAIVWTLAAGVLAGTAASVKYLGLFYVPAALVLLLPPRAFRWLAHPREAASRATRRDVALFLVAALVTLAPTYLHLARLTGNPVFPFYPEIFGPNDWSWPPEVLRPEQGLAWVARVIMLPWDLTFRRHLHGGLPPISPVFVFGVPIVLIMTVRHASLRRPLLIAIAWLAFAVTHGHHFLGGAAILSVAIGASAAALASAATGDGRASVETRVMRLAPLAMLVVAAVLTLGGGAYAAYRLLLLGLPPTTPRARAHLLAVQRPLYPAITLLSRMALMPSGGATPDGDANGTSSDDDGSRAAGSGGAGAARAASGRPVAIYAIASPEMVYYAGVPLLGDYVGPASYDRVDARARVLGSLAAALKEIGVAFLLIPAEARPGIPGTGELIADWSQRASADAGLVRVLVDRHATIYRVDPVTPSLAALTPLVPLGTAGPGARSAVSIH